MATNNPTTLSEPIVIERTFNAPVDRVWKAITTADEMQHWYFELPEFKAEKGFEFEFKVEHDGMNYHHLCKITEVIPHEKLVHTWRYAGHEGESLVMWELFAEGDKTRLRLTHEGLETFPKGPSFAREKFNAGWSSIVGTWLKEYVEKKG